MGAQDYYDKHGLPGVFLVGQDGPHHAREEIRKRWGLTGALEFNCLEGGKDALAFLKKYDYRAVVPYEFALNLDLYPHLYLRSELRIAGHVLDRHGAICSKHQFVSDELFRPGPGGVINSSDIHGLMALGFSTPACNDLAGCELRTLVTWMLRCVWVYRTAGGGRLEWKAAPHNYILMKRPVVVLKWRREQAAGHPDAPLTLITKGALRPTVPANEVSTLQFEMVEWLDGRLPYISETYAPVIPHCRERD